VALLAAALLVPSPATAATKAVNCSTLASTIAALSGEGETLVLNGLCTKEQLGSTGISIPAKVGFTLEGAPGTTSGIDGTGIAGPLLSAGEAGALTVEGLTFEHASTISGSQSAVSLRATRVTILGDSFLENREEGVTAAGLFVFAGEPGGAGCPAPGGPPAFTVRNSTFRGNVLTVASGIGGGAAAFLIDKCAGAGHVLEGNVVEGNVLKANGSSEAVGAGLDVASEASEPERLTQQGDVFADNRIEDLAGIGSYGGAGEWLEGMSATSVGDRFSANTLPGTSGANWSWGAGLGIVACNGTLPTQTTLEDAVVAGNAIVGGTPADDGGAGIYVGCPKTAANHLSLLDSTVTENSAPVGGVAGVDGGPADTLTLANSILEQDVGGAETGGFGGAGGTVAASFSDVCAAGSVSPLSGEGNLCADPTLADDGNPASVDVHETATSRTREAGSNALVTSGLTTDFYGAPRIAGGELEPTCFEGLVQIKPATVDMGAAEDPEALVKPIGIDCPILLHSSFAFPTVSIRSGGVLLLTFHGLAKGTVLARAGFKVAKTVVRDVHGHRRRSHRTVTLAYGQASHTGKAPSVLHLRLIPRGATLAALRAHRREAVTVTVTFAAGGAFPASQSRTVRVRYVRPPAHHRR
jgi:hypothetical protein